MITTTTLEVNALSNNYEELISELTPKEILSLLGILNEMIYVAAINARIILKTRTGRVFVPENILKPITQSLTVITPVKYIADYLKKFWSGLTYHSRNAVARLREVLSEKFKLFTLEQRDWTDPTQRHRTPNPCGNFDFLGALLLARVLESRALTWYKLEELELDWSQPIGNGSYPMVRNEATSMPAHKGYTMVALYNLAFKGIDRWGREEYDFGDTQPLPEVVQAVRVKYQALQAEKEFAALLDADPERDADEVLETETFEVTEHAVIESNGLKILTERVIAVIPLAKFIRRAMKVAPTVRSSRTPEASVKVPCWALEEGEDALAWWRERIEGSGLWLSHLAPEWVWDTILPF